MSLLHRITLPTPALIVAFVALAVALGGTSYAAMSLPSNSVGKSQIRSKAVGKSEVAANAITSSRVQDGTLLRRDFRAGQLPAGPQGPQGPQGQPGQQGAPGQTGERGPSNARASYNDGFVAFTAAPSVVHSITLTPGNWVVTANGSANNNAGSTETAHCTLDVGGKIGEVSSMVLAPNGAAAERLPFSMTGAKAIEAETPAQLICESTGSGNVVDPSITATQVGALN